jgi:hypothetical protein
LLWRKEGEVEMATPAELGLAAVSGGTAIVDGISYIVVGGQWVQGTSASTPGAGEPGYAGSYVPPTIAPGTEPYPFGVAPAGGGVSSPSVDLSLIPPYGGGPLYTNVPGLSSIQFGVDPGAAAEMADFLGCTLTERAGVLPTGPREFYVNCNGVEMNAGLLIDRYLRYPLDQANAMTKAELDHAAAAAPVPGSMTSPDYVFSPLSSPPSFIRSAPGAATPTVPIFSSLGGVTVAQAGMIPPQPNAAIAGLPTAGTQAINEAQQIFELARRETGGRTTLTAWEWNYYAQLVNGEVGLEPVDMGLNTTDQYEFATWWSARQNALGRPVGTLPGGTNGWSIAGVGGGGGNEQIMPGPSEGMFAAGFRSRGLMFLLEVLVEGSLAYQPGFQFRR